MVCLRGSFQTSKAPLRLRGHVLLWSPLLHCDQGDASVAARNAPDVTWRFWGGSALCSWCQGRCGPQVSPPLHPHTQESRLYHRVSWLVCGFVGRAVGISTFWGARLCLVRCPGLVELPRKPACPCRTGWPFAGRHSGSGSQGFRGGVLAVCWAALGCPPPRRCVLPWQHSAFPAVAETPHLEGVELALRRRNTRIAAGEGCLSSTAGVRSSVAVPEVGVLETWRMAVLSEAKFSRCFGKSGGTACALSPASPAPALGHFGRLAGQEQRRASGPIHSGKN